MSAGTLAIALPANAQDEKKDEPASTRDEVRRDRPERVRAADGDRARQRSQNAPMGLLGLLDKDANGELDKAELEAAAASLLTLDKNKDGKVTQDELATLFRRGDRQRPAADRPSGGAADKPTARPTDRGRGFGMEQFAQLDSDGDGKISKEEAPERMSGRWDRMDTNGDGFLDKTEQEAVVKFVRERMNNAGGGGRRDRAVEGQGETDKPKRPAVEE